MSTMLDTHADVLATVEALYNDGLYLQAHAAGQALGPYDQWPGPEARIRAGQLLHQLGSSRRATILHWQTWRQYPQHPKANFYQLQNVWHRRGTWEAWQWMDRVDCCHQWAPEDVGDWYLLRAHMLAMLRDFSSARHWLQQSHNLQPNRAWHWVIASAVEQFEDRHEAALAAAQQALSIRPWYRPAVLSAAHELVQLNRDDAALDLLQNACQRLEAGDVWVHLAALHNELQQHAQAREIYDRLETYFPLLSENKPLVDWLLARRADCAYYCGDHATAHSFAVQVKGPIYEAFSKQLADPAPTAKRVKLPVAYVRQNHSTCAPATVAALAQFWSVESDHLQIAAEICYDGTPAVLQRQWCETHGWHAREFRGDWASTVQLIDRGIPFAMSTVDIGGGHLQAVCGYDTFRGSLLVRDPSQRHVVEMLADKCFERYRSTGPRCMVMVPADRAHLLDGIELPEADWYDSVYAYELALERNDRATAEQIVQSLVARDPNHRLTLHARGSLGGYDRDDTAVLQATEALLAQYPDARLLSYQKLRVLAELGRRDDRLALLRSLCDEEHCNAVFWQQYAQELLADAREFEQVQWLLHRAIRAQPNDAAGYGLLAAALRDQGQLEPALLLTRLATCLDDKDEGRARNYFLAAQQLRQTATALQFLRERFERYGAVRSDTGLTLCWAYEQLEQTREAEQIADRVAAQHPEEGDTLLWLSERYEAFGKLDRANELRAQAQTRCHPANWERSAAFRAARAGNTEQALQHWRAVLARQPLSQIGHETLCELLANQAGSAAAVAHLREQIARFPHSRLLRVLLVEWLRDNPAAAEVAVRELLEVQPLDSWAQRELTIQLLRQSRWADAIVAADAGCALEPCSAYCHYVRGRALLGAGERTAGQAALRTALQHSVDCEPALNLLVDSCNSKAEREAVLDFVSQELVRQVTYGNGLLAFRETAAGTLPPERLLQQLSEAHQARLDLWHAWSALIQQLLAMQQLDEALHLAEQAVERFPLLPRLWFDLAAVQKARNNADARLAALQQAVQICPQSTEAHRELCEAYDSRGDLPAALASAEIAVRNEPRDPVSLGYLAGALWKLERRDEALERLQQALRIAPTYGWAWTRFMEWTQITKQRALAEQLAREVAQARPDNVDAWIRVADVCEQPEQRAECFAALDRALELNPRSVDAYRLYAYYLNEDGRHDEALAKCRPAVFGDELPLVLLFFSARVELQRGEPAKAQPILEQVIAADPDHYSAWQELSTLHGEANNYAAALPAAEQLVRLAPDYAPSRGHRALARLETGDRAGARSDLEHALQLTPEYAFGVRRLVGMHLEDKQFTAAQEVLDRSAVHVSSSLTGELRVRVALGQNDADAGAKALCELVTAADVEFDLVHELLDEFERREWNPTFAKAVRGIKPQPEDSVVIATAWARSAWTAKQLMACRDRLASWKGDADSWHAAARGLVHALRTHRTTDLQAFTSRHREQLMAKPETWSYVGEQFSDLGWIQESLRWLADWRGRAGEQPRYTFTVLINLWLVGKAQAALEVSRISSTWRPDYQRHYHALWCALLELLEGDPHAAAKPFSDLQQEQFNEFYQAVFALVQLIEPALRGTPQQAAAAAKQLPAWRNGWPAQSKHDRLLLRMYFRSRLRLAQAAKQSPLVLLLDFGVWRYWWKEAEVAMGKG